MKLIVYLPLSLLAIFSLMLSKQSLREEAPELTIPLDQAPLYLPDADKVRLVTFGYDHLASHLAWFATQNYFGKQYRDTQDYRWLSRMCDLVTELNPAAHHAFEFCASLLSWMVKDPKKSNELLSKAIQEHPEAWRYRFLRGFNFFYFLGELEKGVADFEFAATLPEAPVPMLKTMASRLLVAEQDPREAVNFLKHLIDQTKNESAKLALLEQLKEGYLSLAFEQLNKSREHYENSFGQSLTDLNSLVSSGILRQLPPDPFEGEFIIDKKTGEIRTTSGHRGLLKGRYSVTKGMYKEDFKQSAK